MNQRTRLLAILILAGSVPATPTLLTAGDLNPPPGPIAPTFKTLVEVEPRIDVNKLPGSESATHVIDEAGSYMLTGNLPAVSGKNGIEIAASDVTLDLNGFCMDGQNSGQHGIIIGGTQQNITVRNGTVKRFTVRGVNLENAPFSRVQDIHATEIGFDGGGAISGPTTVENGTADESQADGAPSSAAVTGVGGQAGSEGGDDLFIKVSIATDRATIVKNSTASNGGQSTAGFQTGSNNTLTDCNANNVFLGYNSGSGNTIRNSTASDGTFGFVMDTFDVDFGFYENSHSRNNIGPGFQGNGITMTNCTSSGDSQSTDFTAAVDVGDNSFLFQVRVDNSTSGGIKTGSSSQVVGSTVRYTDLLFEPSVAISVGGDSVVSDNTVFANLSAPVTGVEVTGSRTSVKGNKITNTNRGVTSDSEETNVVDNDIFRSFLAIAVVNDSVVKGNTVFDTGTGIQVTGSGTSVKDNAIKKAVVGIEALDAETYVSNNEVSRALSTGYDVVPGSNKTEPITNDPAANADPDANIDCP